MSASQRATLYLTFAHLGAIAAAVLVISTLADLPDFIVGFAIGALIVCLAMLLRRGLRDEYFEGLWQAGASLAFIATVVWYVLGPFAEGFIHGVGGSDAGSIIPDGSTGIVAIAAFFTGFHGRMLRATR